MTDRTLIARVAAHAKWANVADRRAATAPGRKAFDDRFIRLAREKHPDATDEQIQQAADSLRSQHFASMAYKSARVRRAGKVAKLRKLADEIEATLPQGGA